MNRIQFSLIQFLLVLIISNVSFAGGKKRPAPPVVPPRLGWTHSIQVDSSFEFLRVAVLWATRRASHRCAEKVQDDAFKPPIWYPFLKEEGFFPYNGDVTVDWDKHRDGYCRWGFSSAALILRSGPNWGGVHVHPVADVKQASQRVECRVEPQEVEGRQMICHDIDESDSDQAEMIGLHPDVRLKITAEDSTPR